MPRLGFPRAARLAETDEFSSVFDFRKRLTGKYLMAYYRPNNLGRPRIGLIASKKIAPAATDRNYMRRVLREIFRVNQSTLGGFDIVIRIQKRFGRGDYETIEQEFMSLLGKLARTEVPTTRNG